MNEAAVLRELQQARQLAPKVIFVEGQTDVPIFFALVGVARPPVDVHNGVLVQKLSGSALVRGCVEVATRDRYPGVYGIIDGDGEDYATLSASFVPPFVGRCFRWPSYSIENMLVKTGWPSSWGTAPDWTQVLIQHVPYSALNRLHGELAQSLRTLRLMKHQNPVIEEPLKTVATIAAALAQDKHLIAGYDVEARFAQEVAAAESTIGRSLDEGHALVNGKWLVDVFAPRTLGHGATPQRCRDEWIAHAVSVGGLPEVRDLWQRITGRPP